MSDEAPKPEAKSAPKPKPKATKLADGETIVTVPGGFKFKVRG